MLEYTNLSYQYTLTGKVHYKMFAVSRYMTRMKIGTSREKKVMQKERTTNSSFRFYSDCGRQKRPGEINNI